MSSAQVGLEDEIPFELMETPTEVEDLIDTFARLVFNITVIEEEMVVDRQMEYQYKGTEEILGGIGETTCRADKQKRWYDRRAGGRDYRDTSA